MKIAVISMSGSVGKTLVATYLLAPRMPDGTRFFAVESINKSADSLGIENVTKLKGREFGELYEELSIEDDAVIDIGASNIESFFDAAKRFTGGTKEIDLYLIPSYPDDKHVQEAIATAKALIKTGVDAKNIRFIPNRVPMEQADNIENLYADLFDFAAHHKAPNMVKVSYAITSDPLFEDIGAIGISLEKLLNDKTDYKALAKAETDPAKRKVHTGMRRIIAQADPIKSELDRIYKEIIKK